MKTRHTKAKTYSLARRLALTLIIGGMFVTSTAGAMPTGGNVITNNGTIGNVTNNVLDVTGSGSSANVVIKWQDFGIKVGETVNFSNMNAVLNYVTGNNKSEIFGKLNGSGVNVFLINPNGVLFGAGAEVSVGSLYTSTAKLDESRLSGFSSTGKMETSWETAAPTTDVVNLGTIKADKLTIRGGNITLGNTASITKVDGSAVTSADKANYVLQSDGAINVGYEVDRSATIDVGDGKGNYTVANDATGDAASGHHKGSDIFTGQKLIGSAANTINDYMLVTDVYDLQNISTKLDGNYMLAGTIDAKATATWNSYNDNGTNKYKGFDPLGDNSNSFTGVFDGLDYTIEGLTIDRGGENYVGLFGYNTGTVQNVGLVKGSIIKGQSKVGGVVGENDGGTVSNVYNTEGSVSGEDQVGGVVGTSRGTISNAYNTGIVTGNDTNSYYAGGVVGWNDGTVTNVYNTGSISGRNYVGGVVGYGGSSGTISNAYNTGNVTGNSDVGGVGNGAYVGGVVGQGDATNAYNEGAVTGKDAYVGGIAGSGAVSDAYNTGKVSGKDKVGGISGDGSVSDSYNTGEVTGVNNVGGVVGYSNDGTVSNAYNTGKVTGTGENVGGVVGYNHKAWHYGIVSNVYNIGEVSGKDKVGGVVGYGESGTISNAYNTGNVTGNSDVGGVIGNNFYSTVTNVYNRGSVSGEVQVGGVVGYNYIGGILNNAYNTGTVTGKSDVGGVVGKNDSTINNAYYAVFDNTDAISGNNVTGYKKHGDTVKTLTQAQFNAAFKAELTSSDDQNAWKVYGDNVSPLLKYWLKPITVTGNNDSNTYTYNGTAQTFSKDNLTYNGEVDANLISVGSKTNAGSYDLSDVLYSTQDGYDITVDSGVKKFEIGKADLSIAANGGTIIYGDAKKDFGYNVSGLVNGDGGKKLSDLYGYQAGDVTYTTDAWVSDGKTNNANADGYDITIDNIGNMELGNYNITVDNNSPNKIVVNKATLTVTAEGNKELTYGSVTGPGYTHTVSGFVNGDTAGNVTISGDAVYSSGGWDDTNKKTGNAGKYDIEVTDVSGLSSQNYAFTIGDTTKGGLTINKAILTVTANGNKNLTYGATIGPTYTYTISGWVNGDTVDKVTINGINSAFSCDGWDSINNKTNNAGKYDINVNVSNLSSTNYDFTGVAATEGLTINKANLIAVADKAEIFMGDLLPQLTGRLEGLGYDDTADKFGGLGFTTNANTGLAGSYGITGQLGNTDWQTNYTFTNAEGNATAFVVKAASDDRKEAALRYLLHVKHNAERECAGKEEAVTQAAVLAVEGTGVRQH